MGDLRLLKFPSNNINEERLKSILESLEAAEDEYNTIDGLLVALINFFDELEGDTPQLMIYDLIQLRGSLESFYE